MLCSAAPTAPGRGRRWLRSGLDGRELGLELGLEPGPSSGHNLALSSSLDIFQITVAVAVFSLLKLLQVETNKKKLSKARSLHKNRRHYIPAITSYRGYVSVPTSSTAHPPATFTKPIATHYC